MFDYTLKGSWKKDGDGIYHSADSEQRFSARKLCAFEMLGERHAGQWLLTDHLKGNMHYYLKTFTACRDAAQHLLCP